MTLTAEQEQISTPPRARRRWWLAGISLVLVLALFAAGIWWLVYSHTYQPLNDDPGLYGPDTLKTLQRITDGVQDTQYVVVGKTGTTATAIYTLNNDGHFAVKLLGLDKSQALPGESIGWAPFCKGGNGCASGTLNQERQFPATLAGHSDGFGMVLYVTVTKPRCPDGADYTLDSIPIRWEALGVHHTFNFQLQLAGKNLPIDLCPNKSALRHIDNS